MSSGGGKGSSGGSGSKSYDYYGTIASAWHVGQMDVLTGIIIDDRLIWEGELAREASTNPVEVTVSGRGIYRHHWGTDDQLTPDDALTAFGNSSGDAHPAYAGICLGVFLDFLFGRERTQAPSVSIRGRRAPIQSLITGAAAALVDAQANPFCVLAELLLNTRFGLGMPAGKFAAASWQAAADVAAIKPELCYVSPFITSPTSVKGLASDLLVLCDGFLRAETGTGLCEAGLFTAPEDIDPDTLGLIDNSSLVGDPDLQPDTWDDVQTTWNVRFRDRDYNFKSRSLRHDDPGALQRIGDVRDQSLQRDFIVRYAQSLAHAREWGRRNSVPGLKGKLPVRSEIVDTRRPGQHIKVNINPEPGGEPIEEICRVISITRSVKGTSKVEVEAVRTLAPVAYSPPPPVTPPPTYEVPCISNFRLFEPTYGLADSDYQLGVLASRPDPIVTDFLVYFDNEEGGVYQQVGGGRSYALRCQVTDAFSALDSGPFHIEMLDTIGREIVAEGPGDVGARDDTLLMFVMKVVGGQIVNDTTGFNYLEAISVSEFTADVDSKLFVTGLRSRRGTSALAFAPGDEVWIISRSSLTVIDHSDFKGLADTGDPAYIRLQPSTISATQPSCSVSPFNFPPNRPKPPAPTYPDYWPPLTLFPAGATFSVECKNRTGTAGLIGFEAYTAPDTPPGKWLTKTLSGSRHGQSYGSTDCSGSTNGDCNTVASGTCGFSDDGTPFDTTHNTRTCTDSGGDYDHTNECAIETTIGDTATLTQTQKSLSNDGMCHTFAGSMSIHYLTQSFKEILSNPDSDDKAKARLIATFADWDSIMWGSATSGCASFWGIRTTGFTYGYTEGKMRVTGSSWFGDWDYTLTFDIMQRDAGSSGAFTKVGEMDVVFPADSMGDIDEQFDVPIVQGKETYVVASGGFF